MKFLKNFFKIGSWPCFSRGTRKSDFHILIVDDEKDFLSSMSVWFKSQGYLVEAVSSGQDALDLLKTKKPNIIFLDIAMPDMDGVETLKRLRKIRPHVPVVMLTKDASEEACLNAYKHGVNGFFNKSLEFYEATHLINSLARVVSKERD
jgi:CheY-like chemotaxis protein